MLIMSNLVKNDQLIRSAENFSDTIELGIVPSFSSLCISVDAMKVA